MSGIARDDAVARIRLIRSARIGPITYAQLVSRFGSAAAALDAVPDLARAGGGRTVQLASVTEAEREIAQVRAMGGRFLFSDMPAFPALLREIEGAPPVLTALGDPMLLQRPTIAVVGARKRLRRPDADLLAACATSWRKPA